METLMYNSEPGNSADRPFRKRKRKSGFFSKAKKFGKQGKLGRGYEIDSETYSYFLNVLELCQKNEFENDEDKSIFIENACKQTENEEVNLSSNQMTSRVMEKLIQETTNIEFLNRFTNQFTLNLRTICIDPFASHVIEKLLEVTSVKWNNDKSLRNWFRNTCQYVLNNFEDFIFNNFANRIMRKVCICLSGTVSLFANVEAKNSNQFQNSSTKFIIPPINELSLLRNSTDESDEDAMKYRKRNRKILKKFAKQFFNWPQVNDLFQKEQTSGFIQCLITTLAAVDEELVSDGILQVTNAINENVDCDSIPQLFTLEACLAVSADNETIFKLLYVKYFQGKLKSFACHRIGHFTLERLINSLTDSHLFEEIFDNLTSCFEEIYDLRYFSIFNVLSNACLTLRTRQAQFVDKLVTILGSKSNASNDENKKENLVEIFCRFGKPISNITDARFQTEFHGCVVMQNILLFHKPFKIVSSFLELDGLSLQRLGEDSKGSRVVEAFIKSTSIRDKQKDEVLQKLKEHLVPLACSKYGSRLIDTMWANSNLKNKGLLASALSERESQLNANSYGKFLSAKCGLSLYKRSPTQWNEVMSSEKKKKKLAEDMMTDLGLDASKLKKQ